MRIELSKTPREVSELETEFLGMLSQHWKYEIACQRFVVIWDEANAEAVRMLGTEVGAAYIALLCRMQRAFDEQYRRGAVLKANRLTRFPA